MVRLSIITTKSGDKGTTALGDGSRVAKDSLRIEAIGTVDETNSTIGLALLYCVSGNRLHDPIREILSFIQNDLFDLGADLCVPEKPEAAVGEAAVDDATVGEAAVPPRRLRISERQVSRLMEAIESLNQQLPPLDSFILPRGTPLASYLHQVRTVARRAERRVVSLMQQEPVNAEILRYLNRLSDLAFILSRLANQPSENAAIETLWQPGKGH